MTVIETTKMSSKGQIVIPEEIRNRLGLKSGDKFIVVGDKDVVILKSLTVPAISDFDSLIKEARKQARTTGLRKSDVLNAVKESRKQK